MMSQGFCLKKRKLPQCKAEVKCVFHTLFLFSPPIDSNVVLFPLFILCFMCFEKRICLSNLLLTAGPSLTYDTRRVLCSIKFKKVSFRIIPVSSKRKQKQCQDQFVNKTRSHPLSYFLVLFLWTNTLEKCMILLLWDTNIFSLGLCSFFFLRF